MKSRNLPVSMLRILCIVVGFLFAITAECENGYRLWLRYDKISNPTIIKEYKSSVTGIFSEGNSPVINSALDELKIGLSGLLGIQIPVTSSIDRNGIIVVGTPSESKLISSLKLHDELQNSGEEGFLIVSANYKKKNIIVIAGNTDRGVLYGTFRFLRLIQTQGDIRDLHISESPKVKVRILNHWDNLDRTVERGYAGLSLWDWKSLPDSVSQRYIDYARANASIGINGTVLTNVNANALVLTPEYLKKVARLADIFRSYGIRVYLTARFSAPVEIGKLSTADPLQPEVIEWWKKKVDEIYRYIPDFGGFTVKANSEGQPGPQNYKRSHADGANMLADALAPHGGIVM